MTGDTPMTDTAVVDIIDNLPDGIVLPPKDVRDSIEKTAEFVSRRPELKQRLLESKTKETRFSFLLADDPYNGYFEWRCQENREGRGLIGTGAAVPSKKAPEKPKGPERPPDYEFSARMPMINAQDLDTLQLTAQFAAAHGPQWIRTLAQREAGNPSFDFLRTQHSLHQFFTRLVDQYTDLLRNHNAKRRIDELEANAKDKYRVLERAKLRAQYAKHEQSQKQKKEDDDNKERIAYSQIDWHDFEVKETIEFTEDETAELDPPKYLSELQSASLEQKAGWSLVPNHMRVDEAMPGDMDGVTYPPQPQAPPVQYPPQHGYYQQAYQPAYSQPAYPMPPMAPAPAPNPQQDYQISQQAHMQAQAVIAAVPAGAPGAPARRGANMVRCPNCLDMVPSNELEQHIKIELLHPQRREQQDRSEARYATTNLRTADVSDNLKRLASQRGDLFDANDRAKRPYYG